MKTLRRLIPVLLVPIVALAAGCGLKGKFKGNEPPTTTLFVQGPVDTVNHIVHLYWFGSDADGHVVGYQIRMLNPLQPAETSWVSTTKTDSVFTLYTPAGYVRPRFEVRAIDNQQAVDPTPAVEDFQFSNQPPVVSLLVKPLPTDTTYQSVSVTWSAADIDGDPAKLVFRVWLDGDATNPLTTTDRFFTMPSARFANGPKASRFRRLYIQAIDDGGMAGNVDSCTWFVRQTVPDTTQHPRLLLVDDVPSTASGGINFRIDTLYANTAARNLPAGSYSTLRLQFTQPFRSAQDLAQTFKLYDAVIWYRANEIGLSSVLRTYGDEGVASYLDAGGRFHIESMYLFSGTNAAGQLSEDLVTRYLNCRGTYKAYVTTTAFGTDSTAGWGIPSTAVFTDSTFLGATRDSIKTATLAVRAGEAGGVRCFVQNNPAEALLWARPSSLTPSPVTPVPVGIIATTPAGGRFSVLTVPLLPSTPITGYNGPVRILAKIFQRLGLAN